MRVERIAPLGHKIIVDGVAADGVFEIRSWRKRADFCELDGDAAAGGLGCAVGTTVCCEGAAAAVRGFVVDDVGACVADCYGVCGESGGEEGV